MIPVRSRWDAAVTYDFECTYDNGLVMRVASNNYCKQGVRFIGEDGWVHVTRGGVTTEPADLRNPARQQTQPPGP